MGSIPIVTTMIEKIIEVFKDAGVSKDKTLEILHKILNTPNIDTGKVDIILVKELSIDEYLLLKNTFIFCPNRLTRNPGKVVTFDFQATH